MAKALLSAFLHDLLENLAASQTKHVLKRFKYLDRLTGVLLNLNALVDDAEEKQFTEGDAVKRWLNELQQSVYHLEELLGEITTKSLGPELQLKHDVRRFFSSKKPYGEADEMKDSLRRIIENMEHLVKEKDTLGLRELVARKGDKEYLEGLTSFSAVLNKHSNYWKDNFYGRKEEEKTILETLLSNGESGGNVTVIKVMGAAGTGKTAFARFIYSNIKVTKNFHIREWVTVPNKSSVCSLLKKILEAISESEEFSPRNDLNLLQTKLKNYLAGKKFLLVLDNCLIEDCLDNWDRLISSLEEAGAKGSAIILTTRPVEDPALVPPAHYILPLELPSTEDCWSIFQAHAFGRWKKVHRDEWLEETVGKKIINKLGNLPLAAKMVGILLQDRPHRYQWVEILTSKFLDAKLHVDLSIPLFLILCYLDLPGKLRLCLAYMSIFPKGYQFKLKDVVFLWMAQGFLQQSGKSIEEVGNEYFSFLSMRSFFQPSGSGSGGSSYIMHNLVHDLASYVFGESSKHHLTYDPSIEDFPKTFPDGNGHLLRTILPLEREPRQLGAWELDKTILQLKPQVLRVLSLSYYDITELPPSIKKVSHLCYLDLSHTALRALPDSIGELYHLQTLLLKNCRSLTSLPKKLSNLKNLRYLDIRDTGIQRMPSQMNKLTSLRTLTDYVVSTTRPRIDDLAELFNLKVLSISELQNLASPNDASSAKLKKKDNLDDLILQWGSTSNKDAENGSEVLENLEPHRNLERLTINNYFGARFPNWLGDASFLNLWELYLCHSENCISLPPLGQVPFLKNLYIEGFNKVSSVGPEFYGTTAAPFKPFRFLEILQFRNMLEMKEWSILEGIEFSRLHALHIIQCPKLVQNLPKQLPSLERLEVFECYNLVASLPKIPNSCRVFIHDSNETLIRNAQVLENSQEITTPSYSGFLYMNEAEETTQKVVGEIQSTSTRSKLPADDPASLDSSSIAKFNELSAGLLSPQVKEDGPLELTFDIPNINISKNDLQSPFVEVDIPITMQAAYTPDTAPHSEVQTSSSEDSDDQVSSSEMLKVTTLSQLKKLPPELKSLKIEGFESLEALPDDMLSGIPILQELHIVDCSSLKSFPSGGYPVSLRTLYVCNCKSFSLIQNQNTKFQFLKNLCIGSSCDSLSSFILNLFPKLISLCIWDCPNLLQMSISDEFQGDLASLESLEIRDCPNFNSFAEGGLPTPNLASILLSNCKSLNNFPNSKNSITSLQSLTLHKCPALESFSLDALPSSLTLLSISFCDKLTPQNGWGLHNLESLSRFKIEGGCIGIKSFPEEKLLPSNIISLCISTLHSLQKLDYKGFQHLNSLQRLEIYCCQQLRSFPEEGLPSSLIFLCIKESPLLTRKLLGKAGKDWLKIAHIPNIQIDDQVIL